MREYWLEGRYWLEGGWLAPVRPVDLLDHEGKNYIKKLIFSKSLVGIPLESGLTEQWLDSPAQG